MFGYKSVKECCYNLTPKLLMVSQRAITGLFCPFDGWFNLAIGAKQLASHSMPVTDRLMDHSVSHVCLSVMVTWWQLVTWTRLMDRIAHVPCPHLSLPAEQSRTRCSIISHSALHGKAVFSKD